MPAEPRSMPLQPQSMHLRSRSRQYREIGPTSVVVVTGASAGIGRASAVAFGAKGARVALLARGVVGLEAAKRDVERAGGTALVIPVDMSDFAAVDAAASLITERLGEIDIWVNVAFATVFAPFADISPEEFRRVTEVSYLGYVHGTMAALARMKMRDAGTIVQVGSALGSRAIPLQSAYCGAKHAINGFTESLRCELLHDKSNVRITVVQMPAVNTPQFSWVVSHVPGHPQPVPPIYEPEVAARAVVSGAMFPEHKQTWIGASTVATILAQRVGAPLLDRYLARTGYSSQQTVEGEPIIEGNLWSPLDGEDGEDFGTRGIFGHRSHAHSPQRFASEHALALVTGVLESTRWWALRARRDAPFATRRRGRVSLPSQRKSRGLPT